MTAPLPLLVEFTVPGKPVPKARPRVAQDSRGRNRTYAEASAEGAAADAAEDGGEDEEQVEPSDRPTHEAGGPSPRLAVTYDGGVSVIDGATLEVLGDFRAQDFVRVNPAGDGRHVFLAEGDSFRLLDAGTWGEPHGDHNHYYSTDPLRS
ncbi:hypothetical protein [Nesterenkonia massiliensis]|uniref:hypothetical protein n=1 Tax=Nesterenkonia massiliensis TaxID=1232429 RepID=UPI0011C8B742|nr:hypothetical protein [Nesterenkonia massiliensis]